MQDAINDWITAEPTKVSAPIDILKIPRRRSSGIQHKEQCPEAGETKIKANKSSAK